ncbi:hypothetical protein LSH36_101g01046, partial [Paralvinella palmiformis]
KTADELDELCRNHNLPRGVFQVRESEDQDREYTVYTSVPLSKGTSFGPYKIAPCSTEHVRDSCLLQRFGTGFRIRTVWLKHGATELPLCVREVFHLPSQLFGTENKICLHVESEAGRWLRLLHTTLDKTNNNVTLRIQGLPAEGAALSALVGRVRGGALCLRIAAERGLCARNDPAEMASRAAPIVRVRHVCGPDKPGRRLPDKERPGTTPGRER